MVWACRGASRSAARGGRGACRISANDLSSRSTTLKRGSQPLDQVGFEQQGVGLGPGGDELHGRASAGTMRADAVGVEAALGVLARTRFFSERALPT